MILIRYLLVVLACFLSLAGTSQTANYHIVETGETLFSLSKTYHVSVDELRTVNPAIKDDLVIHVHDTLLIPQTNKEEKIHQQYVTHVVQPEETLYALSKQYGISVEQLKQLNHLEQSSIQVGQSLIVQQLNEKALYMVSESKENEIHVIDSVNEVEENKIIDDKNEQKVNKKETDSDIYKLLFNAHAVESNHTLLKEKGIGNFLDDSNESYLALVNDIGAETVVRVRNLMNNRVVYLKVVGTLPAKDVDNNVSIKISKTAAKDLKIIEDRFLGEWSWYAFPEKKEEPKDSTFVE